MTFMTIFKTTLKRIMKQPLNWVFILLFPVIFSILIVSTLNGESSSGNSTEPDYEFGVVDQDQSTLSKTLVKQLEARYTVHVLAEEDISATLTNADTPWVLLIRSGYESNVLSGNAPVLEGYSLTVSDVSALGGVTAQNLTRALMLLGSNDTETLNRWEVSARVDVTILDTGDNWSLIVFWFGFFGFVSLFTAYFIVKTLLDDKRHGMPDRLGVLPVTPRRILLQGTLAAYLASEITVVILLAVIQWLLGSIPNIAYLFLLLSIYNLFSVGLVLAIVSIAKDLGAASVVMTMLATIFAMVGGLFWPLDFVPDFMKKLAWFSPGYWLSQGLGNIQSITFEGFVMPILFLAAFTAVVLLLGGWKRIQAADE